MSDVNLDNLSPETIAALQNLCDKFNGKKEGQTASKRDQLFFLETKVTNQIYSHIENCPEDDLKKIWATLYNGEAPDHTQIFIQLEQFMDKCDNKQLIKLHEECVGKTDLGDGLLSIINATEIKL